ncbi:MAG: hypothetical protein V3V09_04075 [Arenicellales bacterium]
MSQKNKHKNLQKELKKIIKKMQRIQKNIAADDQPAAMHEVDALTDLGERYAKVVQQLQAEKA